MKRYIEVEFIEGKITVEVDLAKLEEENAVY